MTQLTPAATEHPVAVTVGPGDTVAAADTYGPHAPAPGSSFGAWLAAEAAAGRSWVVGNGSPAPALQRFVCNRVNP